MEPAGVVPTLTSQPRAVELKLTCSPPMPPLCERPPRQLVGQLDNLRGRAQERSEEKAEESKSRGEEEETEQVDPACLPARLPACLPASLLVSCAWSEARATGGRDTRTSAGTSCRQNPAG
jgi:hypothetical protein